MNDPSAVTSVFWLPLVPFFNNCSVSAAIHRGMGVGWTGGHVPLPLELEGQHMFSPLLLVVKQLVFFRFAILLIDRLIGVPLFNLAMPL